MEIANVIVKTIAGAAAAELQLRVGADIVVRVQAAPLEGGKGLISLAGQLLEARLPPNLTAGQTLPVRVAEATEGQIVLRVRDDAGTRSPDTAAHAAGALAVSGDADLVRVATALAPPGLALPLPNGDALTLHVDGDEDADGGGAKGQGEGDGEAAFVLHSAELGPISVRLRLADGTISATVGVDAATLPLAQAAAPALARGLKQATGTPARVALSGRSEVEPRPAAPHVAEGLDAYA
jgi:hypothetical protein